MTWTWVAEHWDAVTCDLHAVYGVDLGDRAMLRARSWGWLKTRIHGLFVRRSQAHWAALSPEQRGEALRAERGPWGS